MALVGGHVDTRGWVEGEDERFVGLFVWSQATDRK